MKTLTRQQESLAASAAQQAEQISRISEQVAAIREESMRSRTVTERETRTDSTATVDAVIEVFDTSQPVDTMTGTPPLKERRAEHRTGGTRRTTTETARNTTDARSLTMEESRAVSGTETTMSTQAQANSETQAENSQKRGLDGWQKTLCRIGAAAIAALLLWLALTALKHYLKPL